MQTICRNSPSRGWRFTAFLFELWGLFPPTRGETPTVWERLAGEKCALVSLEFPCPPPLSERWSFLSGTKFARLCGSEDLCRGSVEEHSQWKSH